LIALVAYGDSLGDLARRLLAPSWRLVLVFVVAFALTLPHIGHMWRPNADGDYFLQETPPCQAPWNGGLAEWHACHHQLIWFDRPVGLYAVESVATPGGVVTSVAVALGLFGCLLLLRGGLTVERPARAARVRERRNARRADPQAAQAHS
jgi:hypothetical protein